MVSSDQARSSTWSVQSACSFTPDLMPSDITGTSGAGRTRTGQSASFRFPSAAPVFHEHPCPGPDEIQPHAAQDAGRPAPKPWQERQVSRRARTTHKLPRSVSSSSPPRTPIEQEGHLPPCPKRQLETASVSRSRSITPASRTREKIISLARQSRAGSSWKNWRRPSTSSTCRRVVRAVPPPATAVIDYARPPVAGHAFRPTPTAAGIHQKAPGRLRRRAARGHLPSSRGPAAALRGRWPGVSRPSSEADDVQKGRPIPVLRQPARHEHFQGAGGRGSTTEDIIRQALLQVVTWPPPTRRGTRKRK